MCAWEGELGETCVGKGAIGETCVWEGELGETCVGRGARGDVCGKES